ncbi:MAG TPA: TfoX/Sxy family protein [Gemmatimonadaceae bacterium]|nr:TfoX/Sxy family protein [Gemmatimonadaceae bacterium]
MAPDEALLRRVRAALAHTPRVEEKRMFGGVMFMVREKMCISVGQDRLMCRIDPGVHDRALERGGAKTVVMKGREYRGYVHVEAAAVETQRDFDHWVGLALDFNEGAVPSTRRRVTRAKTSTRKSRRNQPAKKKPSKVRSRGR